MVCHVESDVSELDDRVNCTPGQVVPGTALCDDGNVITLPPVPVSNRANDEILPLNELVLMQLTVNVLLKDSINIKFVASTDSLSD